MVAFLGKSLSDEQLSRLTAHLHIDQFAKNEAVNYEVCKELGFMNNSGRFIRKGKSANAIYTYIIHTILYIKYNESAAPVSRCPVRETAINAIMAAVGFTYWTRPRHVGLANTTTLSSNFVFFFLLFR